MLKRGCSGFQGAFTSFHSLKSFILYSTSVASNGDPLIVEYLVKSIGFSEQEAVSIATKVSAPLKSTKKAELVVDFLKQSGFDESQIRKVVAIAPGVLRNNVDKTLKPKIRVLQELGFSGSDLGQFLSQSPFLLTHNLVSSIVPAYGALKSLFGSDEEVIKIMLRVKGKGLHCNRSLKNVPDNIKLLQSYGFKREGIKVLLLNTGFPSTTPHLFEKILKGVEEKLGIPRTSGTFIYGICALTKKSEEKIELWMKAFRNYGWREDEISVLLKKYPLGLSYSEEGVKIKLKYFMEDLGYGSEYLLTCPNFLSYSIEKRIVPRIAVIQTLMDKKLLRHPTTVFRSIKKSHSEFARRFLLPYKDELPELLEYYTQATGYNPSKL